MRVLFEKICLKNEIVILKNSVLRLSNKTTIDTENVIRIILLLEGTYHLEPSVVGKALV